MQLGECGLMIISCVSGTRIVESTDGFRHPVPAFGKKAIAIQCLRGSSKFNAIFASPSTEESPVQGGSEIVYLDPNAPSLSGMSIEAPCLTCR